MQNKTSLIFIFGHKILHASLMNEGWFLFLALGIYTATASSTFSSNASLMKALMDMPACSASKAIWR